MVRDKTFLRDLLARKMGKIKTDMPEPAEVRVRSRQLQCPCQLSSDVTRTRTRHIDGVNRWDPTCWDIVEPSVLCLQSSWMGDPFVPCLRNETWVFVLGREITEESICWARGCSSNLLWNLHCKERGRGCWAPSSQFIYWVNVGKAPIHFSSDLPYCPVQWKYHWSDRFLYWNAKLLGLPVSFWCGFNLKGAFKIFYSLSLVTNWELIFQTFHPHHLEVIKGGN